MFKNLAAADSEQWTVIHRERSHYDPAQALLDLHERLRGLPTYGYSVNVYDHTLQAATRALGEGAGDELVVAALLHDVADELAPFNHGPVAACLLAPWVSLETQWLLHHHSLFQNVLISHGDERNAAEAVWTELSDHPAARLTEHFCRVWDEPSFDAEFRSLPISTFEPIVRRVISPVG